MHSHRYPWFDWGGRLMLLVGRYRGGSFDEVPRGRDLWYRGDDRGRGYVTTYDYSDVRALPTEEWKTFDVQNDGFEVHLGYWPSYAFFGLDRHEMRLFRRWDFWECRVRAEWFGLRRWLFYKGLHHHVHLKKPFACNAVPPANSGGYNHWHCELKRHHASAHRFRNYSWEVHDERLA